MIRKFTCIICPNGCEISVSVENGKLQKWEGASCPRGVEYVTQEIEEPKRNIATSVRVENGELPLVSVRLSEPIPKEKIFDVMDEIKKLRLTAPVFSGQILIPDVLSLKSDVIATKTIYPKR